MELYTTITRADENGEAEELEAIVHFAVASYSPGRPACFYQKNGDPGWPEEPAEFEFEFESAELDPVYKGLPPLTDAELDTLRTWFVTTGHDKAFEAANDNHDDGPDPDDARDRALDDERFWRGLEA